MKPVDLQAILAHRGLAFHPQLDRSTQKPSPGAWAAEAGAYDCYGLEYRPGPGARLAKH